MVSQWFRLRFTYASLGDKDAAFRWLDKAVEQRNWMIIYLKRDNVWDPLRTVPRFACTASDCRPKWRKRMGVEPSGNTTRYPPLLKITRGVMIRLEDFLLYLILQRLTRNAFWFWSVLIKFDAF